MREQLDQGSFKGWWGREGRDNKVIGMGFSESRAGGEERRNMKKALAGGQMAG